MEKAKYNIRILRHNGRVHVSIRKNEINTTVNIFSKNKCQVDHQPELMI